MLFAAILTIIIALTFGIMLSNHIINFNEYIIFWLLYITTLTTLGILLAGFYMSMTIKDLKGKPGPRGPNGDIGDIGISGICEEGCRDKIGYNIIIKAISRRLTQLEDFRKSGMDINDVEVLNEIKTQDYIVYYDNMNFTISEVKEKLDLKIKEGKIKDSKYVSEAGIQDFILDVSKDGDLTINNVYIKEKIKSMCDSQQFKELASVRGPQKLIEYLKDIWISWVNAIYTSGGVNYFLSVGAENDFEWMRENPFNEIKKYDVFYWGLPRKARPYAIDVKYKYPNKVELKDNNKSNKLKKSNLKNINKLNNKNQKSKNQKTKKEGFANYEDLVNPKIEGSDKPTKKNKLKLLHSNDYYFTYDDKGTTMKKSIRAYRPHYKDYDDERYYPLGDVIVSPVKNPGDFGDKMVFGEYGKKKSFSKGRHIGPDRDTILVSGDVKKPIGYEVVWSDLQKAKERHWQCKMCRKHKRYSHYKGVMYRVECPDGYGSLGDIYMSRLNLTDKLTDRVDDEFKPKGEYQPVCIPNDCLETIKETTETKATAVWDSNLSQKGGGRISDIYDYNIDDALIYSLNPSTGSKEYKEGTHENAYNLTKLSRRPSRFDDLTTSEKVEKQSQIPYFYRIKEECIAKRGSVNLGGDDYKSPSIMKEDKHGFDEDDRSIFIENNPLDDNVNNSQHYIIDKIHQLEGSFDKNKEFSNREFRSIKLIMKNIFKKLYNTDYEFKEDQVDFLHSVAHFISFVESLPNTNKYLILKQKNIELNTLFRTIIDPINHEDINDLKNSFGLGWVDIPRADYRDGNYSMHHFFYIDNEGILTHKSNNQIKVKFTKIPEQPFYYYLQDNEDNYYKMENGKLVGKFDVNIEDTSFYFRLKLTGNNANEVFINTNDDRQDEKIIYDPISNELKLVKDPLNAKVDSTSFIIL